MKRLVFFILFMLLTSICYAWSANNWQNEAPWNTSGAWHGSYGWDETVSVGPSGDDLLLVNATDSILLVNATDKLLRTE